MRLGSRMLLDGAVGTELMSAGLKPREEPAELWNRTRPAEVQRVHRAYFDAGADAVQTNTFGGNRLRLAAFDRGTSAEVRALNVAGALLAREVRPEGRLVIGSIGPTGAIPPPEGRADLSELEDAFAEQAMALAEGGVDLLHLETFYHPKEARAALRGVAEGAPGLQIVASMTCKVATGGYVTPLGFAPDVMLSVFLEEEADGVGVNCTLSPAHMLDLVRAIRARVGPALPLFAKPTAMPGPVEVVSPGRFAAGALDLLAAGATAVGGCCGTSPAEIAALNKAFGERPKVAL
jgi:methionine synthase I (cobalamin-dependent)